MTPTNLIRQLGDIAHAIDRTNRLRANQLAELMPHVVALTQRALPNVSDEQLLVWHEEQIAQIRGRHVGDAWAASEPGDATRLAEMEARKDVAYLERNQVVAALAKCFPSGVARTAIEGWSQDWHGCVYIDLPTGQASWHFHDSHAHLFEGLPPYTGQWDGHDTPEKYRRLASMATRAASEPGEVARLAEEIRAGISRELASANGDALRRHELRLATDAAIDRLASTATSPASEAQAGWVMVPREPTHDMLNAAAQTPAMLAIGNASTITQLRSGGQLDPEAFKDGPAMLQAYRAMLASAPQPASSPAAWTPEQVADIAVKGAILRERFKAPTMAASSPVAAEGQKAVAGPTVQALQEMLGELSKGYEKAATISGSALMDGRKKALQDAPVLYELACDVLRIVGYAKHTVEDWLATPTASMADAAEAVAEVVGTHNTRTLKFLPAGVQLPLGALLYATPGPRGENAGGVVPTPFGMSFAEAREIIRKMDGSDARGTAIALLIRLSLAEKYAEAVPDDLHTALQALRATQDACDVTQCPWCGHWGQGYADSGQPVDSCHHEYTLMPWRALWPDGLKQDPTSGMG